MEKFIQGSLCEFYSFQLRSCKVRELKTFSSIRNEEKYAFPETILLILRHTPQNNPVKICIHLTFIQLSVPK